MRTRLPAEGAGGHVRVGSTVTNKKGTAECRAFMKFERLLLAIFFLDRLDATIVRCLGFGLFHGFLGFGGTLGAGFGALLALFVENLLAAEQFEKCLVGP